MTDVTWNPAGDDDTSFGPLTAHNVLGGRTAADAHPAAAVSYDNDVSGLTGDTVQEAIDELATHEGLTTTAHGGIVASTDPRLTDARTPTAHEASHHHDGSDPLDAGDVGAVPVESVGLLPGETNRGTWDIAATYAVGDVVFETGSDLYVATAPSTGAQPSLTPGSWDVLDPTGRHVRLGPGSSAIGDVSTAIGYGSSAIGDVSTAIGIMTSATSDGSTAIGPGSSATGDGSTAIGYGSSATGDGSTAIGYGSSATGDGDINIGDVFRGRVDDPLGARTPDAASITTGFVDLPETAAVTNPAADHQRLVARTDGLYVRDETGAEVGPLGAGGGGGIPETIIDAAGDLIIGTAADTAARLAVGTTGQVLTSNGTTAAWATPPTAPHIVAKETGEFYSLRGITTAASNHGLVLAAGSLHSIPVWLDAGNYDRIGVVTTVAAVSTWRLGVYPSDPTTGRPDGQAPLHDAGTLSTNATAGQLLITTSFTIPTRGVYWLACLVDAFTAAPTVHGWAASNSAFQPDALGVPTSNSSATVAQSRIARSATGVATGAMPATYPASAWANGGAVKIIVRSA